MLKWYFWVFGYSKIFPRKIMWLLDLIGSGLGNLKSENPKPVPPCASFHRFFSRVLGFLITMLHTRVWCSKYFFFIIAYRLRALKTLYLFYLCAFIRKLNHKLKGFLWIILQDFKKKKNIWSIRCLVCPIGPAKQLDSNHGQVSQSLFFRKIGP